VIDTLTNIPSLNALNETLKEFSHPKLMLVDLKDFQSLNLKYSDEAGDFVLCEFAKALNKFSNINDMKAFRVEEDEFALVKDMPFDLTAMEKLIYMIADFIKTQTYIYDGNTINIDAHIGLCLDQNNLLEKAKKALRVAQNEDQPFVTYSEFVNRLLEESSEKVCNLLQKSVVMGTITPFFQNVVDVNKNEIYRETLIRIITNDSAESPKLFLNIAKKRGFYTQTIEKLIEKIIDIKELKAINISCEDLYDEKLFELYIESFKQSNTIFEIQNDEFLEDEKAQEKIEALKSNDIQICLDNIDSIENIKKFSPDFAKVQGKLIRLLHIDPNAISTCKEIISTCKELNTKTIASHINSEGTFEETKKLGFDYFQGYYLGKPTSTFAE
jgi:EAL domain-containing protein (putative c-di-GMP-specific phosphodiesterase class I)